MVGFIILLFFIISIVVGAYKGAILQGIHLLGLVIGYFFAVLFYDNLENIVSLWVPYVGFDIENTFAFYPDALLQNMDIVYFRLCAMLIIILLTWVITKIVEYGLRKTRFMQMNIPLNVFLGSISGFVSAWFWTFFILAFMSVLTFEPVQSLLANSSTADFFIRNTPLLSRQVFNLLLQGLGSLPF